MSSVEALIAQYGFPIILIGATVEGDVTMLMAGVVAHLGLVPPMAALAAGCAGAILSDSICYAAGRSQRERIRTTRAYARVGPFVEKLAARFGSFEVVLARLIYGTRLVSMLLWGALRLPFWRFLAADAIGCALWSLLLGGAGYLFSSSAAKVIGEIHHGERWLLAAAVVGVVLVTVARRLSDRWRER